MEQFGSGTQGGFQKVELGSGLERPSKSGGQERCCHAHFGCHGSLSCWAIFILAEEQVGCVGEGKERAGIFCFKAKQN